MFLKSDLFRLPLSLHSLIMADTKLICPACEHEFKRSRDLIQHFTRNPSSSCRAAGETYSRNIRPSNNLPRRDPARRHRSCSPSTSGSGSTQPTSAMATDPAQNLTTAPDREQSPATNIDPDLVLPRFQGDAFGPADEYTAADFPGLDEPRTGSDDDEASDSDEEGGEDFQGGWEPTRPNTTEDDTEEDNAMDVDEDEVTGPVVPPIRKIADAEREAEVFVTHFVGSAGASLPAHSAQSALRHGFETYESSLPHLEGERPDFYAPFSSKLEWEIAQWAKMDGPSASSFMRLLGIETVSSSSFSLCQYLKCL